MHEDTTQLNISLRMIYQQLQTLPNSYCLVSITKIMLIPYSLRRTIKKVTLIMFSKLSRLINKDQDAQGLFVDMLM